MPIFILGAGFNADAAGEAGHLFAESLYDGSYRIDCGYPLVDDMLRLCFGQDRIPPGNSIENLFSDAQEHGDYGPLARLADRLRYADYRIAQELSSDKRLNCYRKFFQAFPGSHYLTFNYDSLPETFLYRLGHWYPHDGYGVPVAAPPPPGKEELASKKSSALVLHLHGSLCIRTSEFEVRRKRGPVIPMLAKRDEPRFSFDPSSISSNFAPFQREVGDDDARDRVIAPLPDKSDGLKAPFISDTYTMAEALVRESDIVVTIGYSFNPHDLASYQRLLSDLCESTTRRLLVVSPDAGIIANALGPKFPYLSIWPLKTTFKQWVAASFPGLNSRA